MKIILFGSPLNPLSAVAAECLEQQGMLAGIILPEGGLTLSFGGVGHVVALGTVGLLRTAGVWFRRFHIKSGASYACLQEFLVSHRTIPTVYCRNKSEIRNAVQHLSEGYPKFGIISCVFPFLIPIDYRTRPYCMLNIHPGLLPENKGPNPYFWALAKGHGESGLTIHLLTDKFDEGDIVFRSSFSIPPDCSEIYLEYTNTCILRQDLPGIICNLDEWVHKAARQKEGEYYHEPTRADRLNYRHVSYFDFRDLRILKSQFTGT